MRPDALIDLHCDTLTDDMYTDSSTPDTFDDPARTLLLTSILRNACWVQISAGEPLLNEKYDKILCLPVEKGRSKAYYRKRLFIRWIFWQAVKGENSSVKT